MGVLQEKVALITGGESGIGLASAGLLVNEGAQVHLVGLGEVKLRAAVEELAPDRALASVADVADESAVAEAVRVGVERFGHYDVLFSNVGTSGEIANIVDYPSDVFARTLAIHVLVAFHMSASRRTALVMVRRSARRAAERSHKPARPVPKQAAAR